jgi:ribosomal protein S18 acetylase RimI-like enzyme
MVQIRKCSEADFNEVVMLLRQLWPDKPLNTQSLQSVYDIALSSENQKYICAVEDSKVVGFGSLTIKNNLWQEGRLGHIDELVVDNDYRGKGIGRQLLAQLIVLAKEQKCKRVELDTAFHRKEAHRFYEQQGFENRAYLFSMIL